MTGELVVAAEAEEAQSVDHCSGHDFRQGRTELSRQVSIE